MKTCEMHENCASIVTHLGEKGYIYCTRGAAERRGTERCRKMRPWELRWIHEGRPLPSYKPGPEPQPLPLAGAYVKSYKPPKKSVTVPVKVPVENLWNTVVSGVEGGINYWAKVHVYKWHEEKKGDAFVIDRLVIEEIEGSTGKKTKKFTVTLADLVRGLSILAEKYPWHAAAIFKNDGDATTGDVLIQCATLGDIVYG